MRLSLRDLTEVVNREDDPAAALMEGNLPPVRTGSQRALGQAFESKLAQDFRRLCWREDRT